MIDLKFKIPCMNWDCEWEAEYIITDFSQQVWVIVKIDLTLVSQKTFICKECWKETISWDIENEFECFD